MNEVMEMVLRAAALGAGATVILDLWIAMGARLFGISAPNWLMVGRWVGNMPSGRFVHADISQAAPVHGERALGWAVHYGTGVIYGWLLVALRGSEWLREPTLLPPLIMLWLLLAAPYFVMMPGMGEGLVACRARRPQRGTHQERDRPLGLRPRAVSDRARLERAVKPAVMVTYANADFTQGAVVTPAQYCRVASLRRGVERGMLDRLGAGKARATGIERHAPGSHFPPHGHPGGEEILVSTGTFSDADGDYPGGCYLRNPPGSSHCPFSREGATFYLKPGHLAAVPTGEQ